jgi:hypothetical protein
VGVGAGAAVAAWLDVNSFAGYIAAALAAAVFLQLSHALPALRFTAAGCTAAFPFLVLQGGEAGLLWGSALTFSTLAVASVLRGPRRGLVESLAVALLIVVYPAVLASHLVLIKGFSRGSEMVLTFLLMASGYVAVASAVEKLRAGRRGAGPGGEGIWPDMVAAISGVLASQVIALAARAALGLRLEVTAVAILALVVAAAAAVGRAIGEFVSDERRRGKVQTPAGLEHLNAVLLAAPAFYYGFRLYLS